MALTTYADAYGKPPSARHGDVAEALWRTRRIKLAAPSEPEFEQRRAVLAYVNHGRWLVDCPDCANADHVDPDDPIYVCVACGNRGRYLRVIFPGARGVDAIERLLGARPDETTRNWSPGETKMSLERENQANLTDKVVS